MRETSVNLLVNHANGIFLATEDHFGGQITTKFSIIERTLGILDGFELVLVILSVESFNFY